MAVTADGKELPWQGQVKLASAKSHEVVYQASASSAALVLW